MVGFHLGVKALLSPRNVPVGRGSGSLERGMDVTGSPRCIRALSSFVSPRRSPVTAKLLKSQNQVSVHGGNWASPNCT